jgi:hypothetical protein
VHSQNFLQSLLVNFMVAPLLKKHNIKLSQMIWQPNVRMIKRVLWISFNSSHKSSKQKFPGKNQITNYGENQNVGLSVQCFDDGKRWRHQNYAEPLPANIDQVGMDKTFFSVLAVEQDKLECFSTSGF